MLMRLLIIYADAFITGCIVKRYQMVIRLGMSKIKKHYARNKKLLDYALSVKIYDVGCGTGKMGSVAFENFAFIIYARLE